MYKTSGISKEASKKHRRIQSQFMTIERFLDVSKVLVNKMVSFVKHMKAEYILLLISEYSLLKSKLSQSEQHFGSETFRIFNLVLKSEMVGYTSYKEYRQEEKRN
jgi:hypothetical protein